LGDPHAARLREMGQFTKKYGKGIYATRGGPFVASGEKKRRGLAVSEGKWWGGSTYKGPAVYLHILHWNGHSISLPAMEQKEPKRAVLSGGKAPVKRTASGIEISVAPE
jgi:alpha-L-fucosidase